MSEGARGTPVGRRSQEARSVCGTGVVAPPDSPPLPLSHPSRSKWPNAELHHPTRFMLCIDVCFSAPLFLCTSVFGQHQLSSLEEDSLAS